MFERLFNKALFTVKKIIVVPEPISYADLSVGDTIKFATLHDTRYTFQVGNYPERSILVPKGFTTDFTTIPKPFRGFISNVAGYDCIALLHDRLYYTGDLPRSEADFVFASLSNVYGLNKPSAYIAWACLRLFGWYWWNKAKKKRENSI